MALAIAFILVSSGCIGYCCAGCRARWCRIALLIMAAVSIVITSESVGYRLHSIKQQDAIRDSLAELGKWTSVEELSRSSGGVLRFTVGSQIVFVNPNIEYYALDRLPWIITWFTGAYLLVLSFRAGSRHRRRLPRGLLAPSPLEGEGGNGGATIGSGRMRGDF